MTVALAVSLFTVLILANWVHLRVSFRRHREEEREDRTELLKAQGTGYERALNDLRKEVQRMTMVFDGMGAAYDSAKREARAAHEGISALAVQTREIEEQVKVQATRLDQQDETMREIANALHTHIRQAG